MTTKYSPNCIIRNITFIKDNIVSVDRLFDILLEKGVLQMPEWEDVASKKQKEQIDYMIRIVQKKRAQEVFLNALDETGQKLIVEKISKTQKDYAHSAEPKPHTMSLLPTKVATTASFHQEHTSLGHQKENMVERKPHDEYKYLSEVLKKNEVRIKQLESELKKAKQTEKKYSQLEKEYNELKIENKELKAKVEELKEQLKERDEIIKTTRERTSILQDEGGSPVKNHDRTILNLIKSQENLHKLMNVMAKGQQQSEKKFAEATDNLDRATNKLDTATDKLDTATDKLDTATARLNTVAGKIENRPIRHDGRKIASKYSRSTYVSEPTLPQMRQKSTVGNRFSDALTRQNTFNGGVGVPHKLK